MNYFELLIKLNLLYDKHVGKQFTGKQIAKTIQRALPFKECIITSNSTLSINSTSLQVCGVYDPDLDEDGSPPIEVEILFPKKQHMFEFSEKDLSRRKWNEMVFDFACVLGHEFVHMEQFRRRHFGYGKNYTSNSSNQSVIEAQEYYGIPDEVDAYAWTAAANMSYGLVNKGQPYDVEQTGVYITYAAIFDKKHPVVLKLKKKTARYYKLLEQQYHATDFSKL